jgi:hypothetical protein
MEVQRDDLIPGGTKRRGLDVLLKKLSAPTVFYAGTTMGHGALALAHAAQDNGKHAEIFISGRDDDSMVQKLRATNAVLHLCDPLPIAALYNLARGKSNGAAVFPPGFDMPEFEAALAESLSDFDVTPYSEIWTVSVTGTLTRAFKCAFPGKIFKTVSVVKDGGPCDFTAPEKYHKPAKAPPPYPSCPYTDAKLWQFASKYAAPDALIWNTAG